MKKITVRGTTAEKKVFEEVLDHMSFSQEDLDQRIQRKNGFNDVDNLIASHIEEGNWPYSSMMFDPRPWTVLEEKTARQIGSKPKGRLVPREGGDSLGAYINNELLSYQWDDNTRLGRSMVEKWIEMAMTARKYGSAFGIVPWTYITQNFNGKKKTFYDGPDFIPCNPRDVLVNPSYSYIHKWFQYREWVTLDELKHQNDSARGEPIYKNLDLLREGLREDAKHKGDSRSTVYQSQSRKIKGLTDYMGRDEAFPVFELITERRNDRWITFSPRHGVVVRDIKNPFNHGEINVVHLRFHPDQDDIYGVSEFEPTFSQVRGINAHMSAFSDKQALRLRPPIHVNPQNVRMHTLDWSPEAKWLMNTPNQDVQLMKMEYGDDASFQSIYSVMVSSLLNAWGETSQGISSLDPFQPDKTATEVRDSSFTRNVRDNKDQIFLAEALKKQIMFWHSMNQQFMFKGTSSKEKIIRIVGRDAIDYFKQQGLSDIRPTEDDSMMIAQGMMSPEDVLPGPRYPVVLGEDGETVPKLQLDENGNEGNLIIEPGDLIGNYDFIPDIESMKPPTNEDVEKKLTAILGVLTNPTIVQLLAAEGKQPKVSELLVKMFESTNVIKDADMYFEDVKGGVNATNPAGATGQTAGNPAQGGVANSGMGPGPQTVPGASNQPISGGPATMQG